MKWRKLLNKSESQVELVCALRLEYHTSMVPLVLNTKNRLLFNLFVLIAPTGIRISYLDGTWFFKYQNRLLFSLFVYSAPREVDANIIPRWYPGFKCKTGYWLACLCHEGFEPWFLKGCVLVPGAMGAWLRSVLILHQTPKIWSKERQKFRFTYLLIQNQVLHR